MGTVPTKLSTAITMSHGEIPLQSPDNGREKPSSASLDSSRALLQVRRRPIIQAHTQ